MKKPLMIAWLLLGVSAAHSQVPNTRLVLTGKLAWNDFTGEVDSNSPYWAHTSWRVSYTYRTLSFRHDTVQLDMQVQPALLATACWVRPGRQSDGLLAHEQGHYNLALLLAAIFKKQVGLLVLTRSTYPQQVRELYAGILAEIKQLEVQYDIETEHRKNGAAQLAWDRKLELLLKAAEQ
ncbi:MAG: hypothetical protein EOO62_03455 [Hymenobacter sp.]|nr:MAG: hypothetical protein EOO62_03455 [Hymenobacter sp.]